MSSGSGSNFCNSEPTFSNALQNFKQCLKCNGNFKNYNVRFAGCDHDFKLCMGCYQSYIQEKIKAAQLLTCPLCPKHMLLESRQFSTVFENLSWSSKKEIKKYLQKQVSQKQQWICQINNCGGLIPHEICVKCSQHYCPKCRQKQHPLDACSTSVKTAASQSPQKKGRLKCQKCDFENEITKRDMKQKTKKCGNPYCKAFLCVEHWKLWNESHDDYHPLKEKIFVKRAECNSCEVY